ncbi:MAG: hypothetical protein FWH37_01795 [Candidatus Bathyarchaeota archaeon]|nr:hypothetical protein [Candidatus Termiticorpusculum sp.]
MKFKKEICLIVVTLILFVLSTVLYSLHDNQIPTSDTANIETGDSIMMTLPYQTISTTTTGIGILLMTIAFISYKTKNKQHEQTQH